MNRHGGEPAPLYAMAALALVPAIWLGLLFGVSFIATPVKFAAPTLELGPALDVGRVTFALFGKIEWGVAGLLALAVFLAGFPRFALAGLAVLITALALQSFWLLPALDVRVAAIMAGETLPGSYHHNAYGGLEIIKSVTLLALAVAGVRRLHSSR